MKRIILTLGLVFLSSTLFALSCKNFGITIANKTPYTCELRGTTLLFGSLFSGVVPLTISSGETSPTFYLYQDGIGAGVYVDYRCDKKSVAFYSGMNSCGLMAGDIGGRAFLGNDLNAQYEKTIGSSWAKRPGQINWIISN